MLFFANYIKFLKIYIERVRNEFYNAKSKLRNYCVGALLIPLAIAAASSFVVECGASGLTEASEPVYVRLESLLSSGETVELNLSVAEGLPICGMRAVVRYDSDAVAFKGIIADGALADRGGVLSFTDRGGEIAIVVDACENYAGCDLGVLVFDVLEAYAGRESCFELYVDSLYFWDEDELVAADLPNERNFFVVVTAPAADDGSFNLTAETSSNGVVVELTLRAIAPSRCFAAGFDIYAVEIASLEEQRFSVLGVLDGDMAEERAFSHTVSLSSNKRYCVIIKPVVYSGNEAEAGREVVIVIDDGSVIN